MSTDNPENHLPMFCYSCIGNYTTMPHSKLKETLLATNGYVFVNGRLCDIKSKSLGAGVYKVWTKERN